ncbi:MAG TPA: hypothetical protein VGH43_10055 [Jatrophihabitans sp.]|jgi:hypothetical protein
MINRRIAKTAMVGIAASAAAIGLAATAFAAAPNYKITAGTKTSGTIAYTGKATGTSAKPAIQFNDASNGTQTRCVSATASGVMKLGAHVSGTRAATITKTTWTTCTGPLGLKLTPKQVGTWYLNGAARPVNGVTKVFISNVIANVTTSLSGCKFTVKGAADGTYTNSTGKLTLAPRTGSGHVLKASNVGNCVNQINNGDKLVFKGTYTVTTTAGKIKIS